MFYPHRAHVIAPPFDTPPHLVDPSGSMFVWLTDPPGIVDHILEGRPFTSELAAWLVGPVTDRMLASADAAKLRRCRFVHDWRGVDAYDSAARMRIVTWGRSLIGRIERIDITLSPKASPLFRMAVSTGTLAMSMLGVPCVVHPTIDAALRAGGVKPKLVTGG